MCFLNVCTKIGNSHLVLELLTELQGDGEEDQRVVQPRHNTLHFVNVTHLEAVGVQLAADKTGHHKKQRLVRHLVDIQIVIEV